jgi:hypothetical protein
MSRAETSPYYAAITAADADLEDALSHIRAEQDEGHLDPAEACTERLGVLERHLERCRRLRSEHLGSQPGQGSGCSL